MHKFIIQLLLELFLALLLFFNVFVSNKIDRMLVLAILALFLILSIIIYKYRRPVARAKGDVALTVVGMCLILMIGMYTFGFVSGFELNYSVMFKHYISAGSWASVFLIVIITELIRYVYSQIDTKGKKRYWITTVLMVLCCMMVDLVIVAKSYDLTRFSQFYEFFALVLVQSAAKNVLLTYITKKYGYQPCLLYRLIMDLYVYFIPVTPKINLFIEAVILLIFPYVMYLAINSLNLKVKLEPARKEKKHESISTAISAVIFAILVILVSREFTYSMIAVGSGSMTGTINKGDAIIYRRYDKAEDELDANDVIVFKKNNMLIVHRIIKKYKSQNEVVYQTKGDANESADNWIVVQDEVVGKVKVKVPLIAWPSVLLNELF